MPPQLLPPQLQLNYQVLSWSKCTHSSREKHHTCHLPSAFTNEGQSGGTRASNSCAGTSVKGVHWVQWVRQAACVLTPRFIKTLLSMPDHARLSKEAFGECHSPPPPERMIFELALPVRPESGGHSTFGISINPIYSSRICWVLAAMKFISWHMMALIRARRHMTWCSNFPIFSHSKNVRRHLLNSKLHMFCQTLGQRQSIRFSSISTLGG